MPTQRHCWIGNNNFLRNCLITSHFLSISSLSKVMNKKSQKKHFSGKTLHRFRRRLLFFWWIKTETINKNKLHFCSRNRQWNIYESALEDEARKRFNDQTKKKVFPTPAPSWGGVGKRKVEISTPLPSGFVELCSISLTNWCQTDLALGITPHFSLLRLLFFHN